MVPVQIYIAMHYSDTRQKKERIIYLPGVPREGELIVLGNGADTEAWSVEALTWFPDAVDLGCRVRIRLGKTTAF